MQEAQDSERYSIRGITTYDEGDYQRAISLYEQALRLHPHSWETFLNLGMAYEACQEYEKSLEQYQQALTLTPENAVIHFHQGNAFVWLKRFQEARDAYTSAIACWSSDFCGTDFYEAYGNRGHVLSCLGFHREALRDYEYAFRCAPKHSNTAWTFLWSHLCQKIVRLDSLTASVEQKTTILELRRIARRDADGHIASLCRGMVEFLQGNTPGALIHFEQAASREPRAFDPPFWIGMALASQQQDERARKSIEDALLLGFPPILLLPLSWLREGNPHFFTDYVAPLLETYGIVRELSCSGVGSFLPLQSDGRMTIVQPLEEGQECS